MVCSWRGADAAGEALSKPGRFEVAGRVALCLALSEGRHVRPASDDAQRRMERITAALRANGWRVDGRLRPAAGDMALLLDRNEFRGVWHLMTSPDD